jgi:predicted AlkP superfamily phosphohydrolase/phosphomutase/Tfp pilus assembly protein PilF
MFRTKWFRAIALLAGMAAVIYVVISLFLPSSRRLILGVDKKSGEVRLVGNHVTFLPPHQFYRLSFEKREGSAQRDGLVRIVSKEQVPVTITYRLRFGIPSGRLQDARSLVRDGWSFWIRKRVGEAVAAVTQQVPIEELLSPTSHFSARRGVLREVVARHLAQSGLKVTAFEIARIEPDRRALLENKRQELRRNARGVAGRIAIIAIDGADWDLLTELAIDGRIPNIQALIQNGTTASMQTIQPTVSPMVWTTMSTGLPPDRHGVIDFRVNNRPVDSNTRRAPALWDIAQAFGRPAIVTNWWTSWPPRRDSAMTFDTPVVLQPTAIYPPDLAPRADALDIPPQTVLYPQVRRFLNITEAEWNASVHSGGPTDPVNVFRDTLAKTWTDHRVAISLYQQKDPLVMLMSYEGADMVNHLFAPYHPPYREGISQTSFRKYWPAVANYYSELDRLIGEWMRVLTDDTTVMIVSAHGFRWDRERRPRAQPIGRSGLSDHRNPGVLIAYGNHILPSRGAHAMSLYDVVPTVLSLLGLPKSTEMPGDQAAWMFRDITPVTSVRVVSYDEFFGGHIASGEAIDAQKYLQRLQAIGHVIDPSHMQAVFEDGEAPRAEPKPIPPAQWGIYAYQNNLGIELRRQNKLREATEAFQAAIDRNPSRPIPYLNLAMTLLDRQQYSAADDVFMMAVERGLQNAEQWFVDFAAYYRSRDMPSRAVNLLYRGKQAFPQSYLIAANLGSALAQSSRYTEAVPELERALGLKPSSTLVLNNLGTYYARRNDYARALDFWNRSLSIDPRQPNIHEAADAARTHL